MRMGKATRWISVGEVYACVTERQRGCMCVEGGREGACVWREGERVHVCGRRERGCMCVEGGREGACVCVRQRECMCVCEAKGACGRERGCMCVCEAERVYVFV